jgi:predicted protein tyrosine phosphatase
MILEVVNRGIIQKIAGDYTSAVISICSGNDVWPTISKDFGAVCKLRFDDWDAPPDGFECVLFDEHMAARILDFVENLPKSITRVIVHCDAGISRSPGVAVALNEIYNSVKIVPPAWQMYNRLVYRTIITVYNNTQCKKSKTT